ncbi:hypothetical protein H4R33_000967 [Dimargaris cristalligena]|uniref:Uncharacterized protein n=1 Tax=Dimargaris cristalligena TaxID=215637 RepID=A0A4P9ZTR1_9FUNG|nr:hypothetical protein H4R33_000967 [Dimargaris cristalligena]RKP36885.1 hypothetical protein BJ085DRAFT_31418 [Dimargaris cristalligena]|eukprot:RKP36885.1 hypothetical protein BJ085DRAFT_31418 [Dimargaris cristalligena]
MVAIKLNTTWLALGVALATFVNVRPFPMNDDPNSLKRPLADPTSSQYPKRASPDPLSKMTDFIDQAQQLSQVDHQWATKTTYLAELQEGVITSSDIAALFKMINNDVQTFITLGLRFDSAMIGLQSIINRIEMDLYQCLTTPRTDPRQLPYSSDTANDKTKRRELATLARTLMTETTGVQLHQQAQLLQTYGTQLTTIYPGATDIYLKYCTLSLCQQWRKGMDAKQEMEAYVKEYMAVNRAEISDLPHDLNIKDAAALHAEYKEFNLERDVDRMNTGEQLQNFGKAVETWNRMDRMTKRLATVSQKISELDSLMDQLQLMATA